MSGGGNGVRLAWLVAVREMRERSRSAAFVASVLVMMLLVVGVILIPALVVNGGGAKNVGLAGVVPAVL